jgi:DNA-binding transcriptional ArsR family regulator
MKSSGRILDAGALKALAHPLRVRLLDLLAEVGPSTASGLGRLVGENSGSTSYHLRQLARHGLIEEAEGLGTARDRYWKVVEGGWTLDGFGMLQDEDTAPAARFLLDEVHRTRAERMARWHADAPRWGEAWVAASVETTARLRLTRAQLATLTEELVDLLDRYRDAQVADDVPDSALVAIHLDGFPMEDPPTTETTEITDATDAADD